MKRLSRSRKELPMSIDKSLRRKNSLARSRNVLTRGERIKFLMDEERWQDGRSPFGLPKVRVVKHVVKKKAKKEEAAEGAAPAAGGAAPAAAAGAKPAAAGAKPAAAAAAAKPAAKGGEKKK
jgi:small basic protein (TIGR04137 family)